MYILKCHIENFGTLSALDIEFNNGINEFLRENGSGKSTLAEFIKAMLYGLETDKKNSVFNDRRHFYPFNGGKFGGSLEAEAHGDIWRIERTFHRQSAAKDTLKLFKNGEETALPENGLGEMLFGLDKLSFSKTVFIGSGDVDISSTSSINAKLNDLVDSGGNGVGFDKAYAALESERKKISADKKANDIKTQLENARFAVLNDISRLEEAAQNLGELYSNRNALALSVAEDEKILKAANEKALMRQNAEIYEEKLAAAEKLRRDKESLDKKYPKGLPNAEEVAQLNQYIQNDSKFKALISNTAFDSEKQAELTALQTVFSDGLPDESETDSIRSDISALDILSKKVGELESADISEQIALYEEHFSNGLPDETAVSAAKGYADKISQLRNKLDVLEDESAVRPDTRKPAVFAFLGAGAVIAGIIVLIYLSVPAGIAILAFGILILTAALVRTPSVQHNENGIKAEIRAELRECEGELSEFLNKYRYFSKKGVQYAFFEFEDDLDDYQKILAEKEVQKNRLDELKKEKERLAEKLFVFFEKYGIEHEPPNKAINTLSERRSRFEALKKEKNDTEKNIGDLKAEMNKNLEEMSVLSGKYGLRFTERQSEEINIIELDSANHRRLENELLSAVKAAEAFKASHKLPNGDEVFEEPSVTEERLNSKKTDLGSLNAEILQTENETIHLPEKQAELSEINERYDKTMEKLKIYSAAAAFLKQAEQNLKDRYVRPVKDSYLKYSDMLEKVLGEKVSMDRDYRIFFERNGENKSERHLSAGQRSLCALCFRLALVENMFKNEKPFIILDDPFLSLDETHLKKAKELLKGLDMQILYFCCHESRKI